MAVYTHCLCFLFNFNTRNLAIIMRLMFGLSLVFSLKEQTEKVRRSVEKNKEILQQNGLAEKNTEIRQKVSDKHSVCLWWHWS